MELNYGLALVPVLNVSLAGREIMSGLFHWNYIAVVFGSMCLYAAAGGGRGRRPLQTRRRALPHLNLAPEKVRDWR